RSARSLQVSQHRLRGNSQPHLNVCRLAEDTSRFVLATVMAFTERIQSGLRDIATPQQRRLIDAHMRYRHENVSVVTLDREIMITDDGFRTPTARPTDNLGGLLRHVTRPFAASSDDDHAMLMLTSRNFPLAEYDMGPRMRQRPVGWWTSDRVSSAL
ncbi:MAG: hypothetical protein SW127_21270, partial [Actinomycetota bacterium]|nr:hypothetical protein [Actinomycetota bacterium]